MGHAAEAADSNVFHKAIMFDPAVGAYLKRWRPAGESLTTTTRWHGRFGRRFDRLRDVEIGDVTGEGEADIVIRTYDQGMVTADCDGYCEPQGLEQRQPLSALHSPRFHPPGRMQTAQEQMMNSEGGTTTPSTLTPPTDPCGGSMRNSTLSPALA